MDKMLKKAVPLRLKAAGPFSWLGLIDANSRTIAVHN